MKTRRILAILVATLIISSALYAAPKQAPANHPNPTVTTDGAIWGGSSAVPAVQPGNSQIHQNNASEQGNYHQSLVDLLKSLGHGIIGLLDGAIWG